MLDNAVYNKTNYDDITKEKRLFIDGIDKKNFKGIKYNNINKFLKLLHTGKIYFDNKLSDDEIIEFRDSYPEPDIDHNIFDQKIIKNYIHKYRRLCRIIDNIQKRYYKIDYDNIRNINLEWFDNYINVNKTDDINSNIIMSLLHGFRENIVKKIDGTPLYVSINNPDPTKLYAIKRMGRKYDGFISKQYMSDYFLFLKRDNKNEYINLLHPIKVHQFKPHIYIREYSKENIKNILQTMFNNINKKNLKSNMIHNFMYTINKIERDIGDVIIKSENDRGQHRIDPVDMNYINNVFTKYVVNRMLKN